MAEENKETNSLDDLSKLIRLVGPMPLEEERNLLLVSG